MRNIDTKRVAKNSLVLYLRVILSMALSLASTRIVLRALGVDDFGIYNVVGGVVLMFNVVSSSLSSAISRFITYELGHGDNNRVKKIFFSTIYIQIIIAGIVLLLSETIGVWFVNVKLSISETQIVSANWVYQFSVIAFLIELISVPYNALIIAHERMKVFAYVGIGSSILKLCVAYIVLMISTNKLIMYGFLVLLISLSIRLFYGFYCKKEFEEARGTLVYERGIFKEVFSFAGWNFIGASAGILREQGSNILLNVFFGPIVNASKGIATQVSAAATTFTGNFMMALNPQITKSYAAGEKKDSLMLVYRGAKFGFFLMSIVALPIIFETSYILRLWLGEVPEFSIIFVQLILINSMIDVLSSPLMTIMLAHGKIKKYQIVVGGCNLSVLPIVYIIFKFGYQPPSVFYVTIAISIIALVLRLILLKNLVGISPFLFFRNILVRVILVLVLIIPLVMIFKELFKHSTTLDVIIVCLYCIVVSCIVIYTVGLSSSERHYFNNYLRKYIQKIKL